MIVYDGRWCDTNTGGASYRRKSREAHVNGASVTHVRYNENENAINDTAK